MKGIKNTIRNIKIKKILKQFVDEQVHLYNFDQGQSLTQTYSIVDSFLKNNPNIVKEIDDIKEPINSVNLFHDSCTIIEDFEMLIYDILLKNDEDFFEIREVDFDVFGDPSNNSISIIFSETVIFSPSNKSLKEIKALGFTNVYFLYN